MGRDAEIRTSAVMGQPVRMGDHAVPRAISLTMTGDNGSPDVLLKFEVRSGRPECVDLHVSARPKGRGIANADIGIFNIDTMAESVFLSYAMTANHTGDGDTRITTMTPALGASERAAAYRDVYEARRRSRGVVSDEELEQVAEHYRNHIKGYPTKAVADFMRYSDRTAARRVQQARKRGLLPETSRGKKSA